MWPKSNRDTRFPGNDQIANLMSSKTDVNTNRRTRFPGGTDLQPISIKPSINLKRGEEAAQLPPRLPSSVNPPSTTPTSLPPVINIQTWQQNEAPHIQTEDPWDKYTALRGLERGGEVTAACTQAAPVKMVVLKKLSSNHFKNYAKYEHENLLSAIEVFRYKGTLFVVTDYTAASLKQIIAIPLPLEQSHISATCRQIFEGMQHLSQFGIAHKKLDSSKILFLGDGCVKIAHFDDCQSTESASARQLGVIAMEMMQNCIPAETDGELVLQDPDRWSAEAKNFLGVASWGTLNDIKKHIFLKYESPTIMIPFVEWARWDTIESLSMLGI